MTGIVLPRSFNFCHTFDFLLIMQVLTLRYEVQRLIIFQLVETMYVKLVVSSNRKKLTLKENCT